MYNFLDPDQFETRLSQKEATPNQIIYMTDFDVSRITLVLGARVSHPNKPIENNKKEGFGGWGDGRGTNIRKKTYARGERGSGKLGRNLCH